MLRRRTKIRTAHSAALLCWLVFVTPGCSDGRTPYEAYLACDRTIAEATSMRGALSCYTGYQRDLLRVQADEDDAWLGRFQGSRPILQRLHEEQLQDVADESILLFVGHTKFGQPVAISVVMHRDGGRWKISREEFAVKGAAQDDVRPAKVSLKPVTGQAWYPGELAGSVRRRPDGSCQLSLAHVFDYPMIRVTLACQQLAALGTYSLEDLVPAGAQATGSMPVTFYDDRHAWFDRIESGRLTISKATDGVVSGDFTFDAASASDRMPISGSFSNLPFDHED